MESIKEFIWGKSLETQEKEMQEIINNGLRDLKYDEIKVLRRPVSSNINLIVEVATHVYLGYFENKKLVDSLSFDPNEGQGIKDPKEEWNNEFTVIVGERKKLQAYWSAMKDTRKGFDEKKYILLKWNCGHVASYLLDNCPVHKDDLSKFKNGAAWALAANKVANITNQTSYDIYSESDQKKDQ
ncbi:hypothetical protein [Aureispira anguillae]|uniref:Uncharacterized protein n=1 Tax=Aureispira anguillae TaxID=2864201 RepID=A0A915YIY4_9BACT|nr:hypothetical protein [Aureispira anguillae]BDS13816.1 hypothetical protein AsAng_0045780 [Aureispira anguillae]